MSVVVLFLTVLAYLGLAWATFMWALVWYIDGARATTTMWGVSLLSWAWLITGWLS